MEDRIEARRREPMQNKTCTIARALTVGAAGAVLAGPFAAPAGAARVINPIAVNPIAITPTPAVVANPAVVIDPKLILVKPADLRLEAFDITPVGGGNWKLKAT